MCILCMCMLKANTSFSLTRFHSLAFTHSLRPLASPNRRDAIVDLDLDHVLWDQHGDGGIGAGWRDGRDWWGEEKIFFIKLTCSVPLLWCGRPCVDFRHNLSQHYNFVIPIGTYTVTHVSFFPFSPPSLLHYRERILLSMGSDSRKRGKWIQSIMLEENAGGCGLARALGHVSNTLALQRIGHQVAGQAAAGMFWPGDVNATNADYQIKFLADRIAYAPFWYAQRMLSDSHQPHVLGGFHATLKNDTLLKLIAAPAWIDWMAAASDDGNTIVFRIENPNSVHVEFTSGIARGVASGVASSIASNDVERTVESSVARGAGRRQWSGLACGWQTL